MFKSLPDSLLKIVFQMMFLRYILAVLATRNVEKRYLNSGDYDELAAEVLLVHQAFFVEYWRRYDTVFSSEAIFLKIQLTCHEVILTLIETNPSLLKKLLQIDYVFSLAQLKFVKSNHPDKELGCAFHYCQHFLGNAAVHGTLPDGFVNASMPIVTTPL